MSSILKLWPVAAVIVALGIFLGFSFYAKPHKFISPQCESAIKLIEWVETADPIADAKQALQSGNRSRAIVKGYSKMSCNPRHRELNAAAEKYADLYDNFIQKNAQKVKRAPKKEVKKSVEILNSLL